MCRLRGETWGLGDMQKTPRRGWVYVLSNESMPGVVKIGRTTVGPLKRLQQLNYLTGVVPGLLPFEVEFYVPARHPVNLEARAKATFREYAVSTGREYFRVDLATVRAAFETMPGAGPIIDGPERPPWPWRRPPKERGRYMVTGNAWGWLYDNYPTVLERVGSPGFQWETLAYEVGLGTAAMRGRFSPPPPDVVRHLWGTVYGVVARRGWNPRKGRVNADGAPEGPPAEASVGGHEQGAREEVAAVLVDAGPLRGVAESLCRKWAELGGAGGGVQGGGADEPGWEPPEPADGATDLVSAVSGHGEG